MEYEVRYTDRRTLGLTVERDTSIIVRAPKGTDPERIEQFVQKKKAWIKTKQAHPQKTRPPRPIKEFVSGESIFFLGQSYRLEIKDSPETEVELAGRFLVCGPRGSDLRSSFKQWFVQRAQEIIPARANDYASKMGVSFEKIRISEMKYRWGSCTPARTLNFNWRLIKAPMRVVDYVIVHELAHLLEHNHSLQFWQHVKTQCPRYEAAKEWLKRHGQYLDDDF